MGLSPRVRGNRIPGIDHGENVGSIPACAGEPACWGGSGRWPAVYPRVCGGTGDGWYDTGTKGGLSPRVRGNRHLVSADPALPGSIPACAGEPTIHQQQQVLRGVYPRVCGGTGPSPSLSSPAAGLSPRVRGNPRTAARPTIARGVYPRVCGGTSKQGATAATRSGLSPRVRGNRVQRGQADVGAGSIPACAGEPARPKQATTAVSVYPRVCGGTLSPPAKDASRTGLSPRVRGNLGGQAAAADWEGSIPACAGEPCWARGMTGRTTVYPRVCGGTAYDGRDHAHRLGLSPRVRGNPAALRPPLLVARSIPACAGEPQDSAAAVSGITVYPRVCGGTEREEGAWLPPWGLSPRVRGNLPRLPVAIFAVWSIPACAGEPVEHDPRPGVGEVYPRVCGGTRPRGPERSAGGGLSPRVRGNPATGCPWAEVGGSIPACAGEPPKVQVFVLPFRVYPRVCGGTMNSIDSLRDSQGLSPRVRGNP